MIISGNDTKFWVGRLIGVEPNGMVTPFFKPATSALADLPRRVATTEWMAYLLHKAMECDLTHSCPLRSI